MGQLKMYRPDQPIPEYTLPDGFTVRSMLPGEEDKWAAVYLPCVHRQADEPGGFKREMWGVVGDGDVLLLLDGERAVGTATAQVLPDEGPYLHCVGIVDSYRSRHLSRPLVTAVLRRHIDMGRTGGCYLTTGESHMPAIKLYHSLGFRPVQDGSAGLDERWKKVYEVLGIAD